VRVTEGLAKDRPAERSRVWAPLRPVKFRAWNISYKGFVELFFEPNVRFGRRTHVGNSFREDSMLRAEDVALVRASFAQIAPLGDAVADLFYERLFEIAPGLRPMFPTNLAQQKRKLMAMIATAVGGLDDLEGLIPQVKALGARHANYGVTNAHYGIVGEVLTWTLARGLGDGFTTDTRIAWTKVFGVLAGTMQAGAAEVAELCAAE
jgi:nitric oxide dioxygenase